MHAAPAKLAVAQINEGVFLTAKIEGEFPRRVVCVEQKAAHMAFPRMQGRLADLVRKAVAHVDPAAARGGGSVVVVAPNVDHFVIVAVAVEYHAPVARHISNQTSQIELISLPEVGGPLKDEHNRVGRLDIARI